MGERMVVWHRGAGYLEPENGFAAFDRAVAGGAPYVELDVRRLADGGWAVWHDTDVDRLTDGTGPVASYTTARYRALTVTASRWFGAGAKDGPPLLLGEVLDRYAGRLGLLLHLNTPRGAESAIGALLAELAGRGLTDGVMVQSWDLPELLPCVRAGVPAQQLLIRSMLADHSPDVLLRHGIRRVSIRADEAGEVTDAELRRYVEAGLTVQAHGIDRQYQYHRLAALGVTEFCTDDPEYLTGCLTGDLSYRRAEDPFGADRFPPGHVTNLLRTNNVSPETRGELRDGWWLAPAGDRPLFAVQGWACPLPDPTRYELEWRVRLDGGPAGGWWGAHVCADTDYRFDGSDDDPMASGYTLAVDGAGDLSVLRRDPDGTTALGRAPVGPLPDGTTVRVRLRVGPEELRVDWAGPRPVTLAVRDACHRGPYFHLGRAAGAPSVAYGQVRVGVTAA